jgi:hypothetical protein
MEFGVGVMVGTMTVRVSVFAPRPVKSAGIERKREAPHPARDLRLMRG